VLFSDEGVESWEWGSVFQKEDGSEKGIFPLDSFLPSFFPSNLKNKTRQPALLFDLTSRSRIIIAHCSLLIARILLINEIPSSLIRTFELALCSLAPRAGIGIVVVLHPILLIPY
jgi:hypothetical protein